MKDNNDEKLKVNMVVNSMTPLYEDGSKNVINLNLVSEEFLRNEMGESRCRARFNGNISDNIEKIFKDRLKTKKPLDIERTSNDYNFLGNGRKPYYMLNFFLNNQYLKVVKMVVLDFFSLKLQMDINSNQLINYLINNKRNHMFLIILLMQKKASQLVMMEKYYNIKQIVL